MDNSNLKEIIINKEITQYLIDVEGNVYRRKKNGEVKEKPLTFKNNKGRGCYVGLMHKGT